MTIELSQEMIQELKTLAERSCWGDALCAEDSTDLVVDYSGSNVDDAYAGGKRTGQTDLARELCDKLGIAYTDPRDE